MVHERIIKDERGKIVIQITLSVFDNWQTDRAGNKFRWDSVVFHAPKGKKSMKINNEIATPAEIWGAKMELHELIKPI